MSYMNPRFKYIKQENEFMGFLLAKVPPEMKGKDEIGSLWIYQYEQRTANTQNIAEDEVGDRIGEGNVITMGWIGVESKLSSLPGDEGGQMYINLGDGPDNKTWLLNKNGEVLLADDNYTGIVK